MELANSSADDTVNMASGMSQERMDRAKRLTELKGSDTFRKINDHATNRMNADEATKDNKVAPDLANTNGTDRGLINDSGAPAVKPDEENWNV